MKRSVIPWWLRPWTSTLEARRIAEDLYKRALVAERKLRLQHHEQNGRERVVEILSECLTEAEARAVRAEQALDRHLRLSNADRERETSTLS